MLLSSFSSQDPLIISNGKLITFGSEEKSEVPLKILRISTVYSISKKILSKVQSFPMFESFKNCYTSITHLFSYFYNCPGRQ